MTHQVQRSEGGDGDDRPAQQEQDIGPPGVLEIERIQRFEQEHQGEDGQGTREDIGARRVLLDEVRDAGAAEPSFEFTQPWVIWVGHGGYLTTDPPATRATH